MKLRKEVRRYEVRPRGYGYAWEDVTTLTTTCYPVPLNLVMRVLRWVYLLMVRGRPNRWDWALRAAREVGRQDALRYHQCLGYDEGFAIGYITREDEVQRNLERHDERYQKGRALRGGAIPYRQIPQEERGRLLGGKWSFERER